MYPVHAFPSSINFFALVNQRACPFVHGVRAVDFAHIPITEETLSAIFRAITGLFIV